MEIIIIVGIGFVVFFIGFGVGRAGRHSPPLFPDEFVSGFDRSRADRAESERDYERVRRNAVEQELDYVERSCRLHHQPPFLGCDGCHHTTRYFAQTVEQQRIADMLGKAKDTAKQLVKDLSA